MSPSVSEVCKHLSGSTLHFPVKQSDLSGKMFLVHHARITTKITFSRPPGPTLCRWDFLTLSISLCIDLFGGGGIVLCLCLYVCACVCVELNDIYFFLKFIFVCECMFVHVHVYMYMYMLVCSGQRPTLGVFLNQSSCTLFLWQGLPLNWEFTD